MEFLGTGANILLVLIGFGLLVAVHEFGHFIAAKWAGVRVDSFAVGMGPVVVGYRRGIGLRFGSTERIVEARCGKRTILLSESQLAAAGIGETEYSLRALPLGGFVRMLGQDDLDPGSQSVDPRSYTHAPIWKRMIIVSAGVFCNIVLAVIMFMIAFMVGVRFEAPVVGAVRPASPAANAGMRAGDHVVRIDGSTVSTFADLQIAAAMSKPNQSLDMTVERMENGSLKTVQLDVMPEQDATAGMRSIGIAPAVSMQLTNDSQANPFLLGVLQRAGFWNHSPDGMPGNHPWGITAASLCGPDGSPANQDLFADNFSGATLLQINGQSASAYSALDDAAAASDGAPIATRWSFAQLGEFDIALNCDPNWQTLIYTEKPKAATVDFELGLLGMAPLVRIERVPASSPSAGILQDRDVVLRVGDIAGPGQMDFRLAVQEHAGKTIAMRVLRGTQEIACDALVGRDGKLGVEISSAWNIPIIARPFARTGNAPGTPTAIAPLNLMPLTRIDSVAGQSIGNWNDFFRIVRQSVLMKPQSAQLEIITTPPTPNAAPERQSIALDSTTRESLAKLNWRPSLSTIWFTPAEIVLSANGNPLRAVGMGFAETHKMVLMTYLTLDRLFRGTVAVSQLRGPVGIVHIGTRIADRGVTYLVFFLAMISVNLAVINFLPIPIADGGLMVFLIYERLRGKPPSPAFQNGALLAGLALVGLLFAVTFYNDVMRLVG